MGKKIISFSLWKTHSKYLFGALKNVELAKKIYPDWICRFYVSNDVPYVYVSNLKVLGAEIVETGLEGNWEGLFWRYFPTSEEDVDVCLVRDCDSRLNMREKQLVDEWLESDKIYHTIIDHPWHSTKIMPGLFGAKKNNNLSIVGMIHKFDTVDRYGIDYTLFDNVLYSRIKNDILIHDFKKNINIERDESGFEFFCGEIFDQNDDPVEEHRRVLREWEKNNKK